MADVKYQVFISSTYEDLREHRDQVIRAVLEMGHIPVGMEMFSAADDEQWKIIQRQIDVCDYYIVLVAHRYGSQVAGVSYTEKEYDYAVSVGVPCLGFIVSDDAPWSPAHVDTDPDAVAKLADFKEKVKRKPVGFWTTKEQLHGMASIALMKAITANRRPGWVRATGVASAKVMEELTRLSSENAELRRDLERAKAEVEDKEEREMMELFRVLIDAERDVSIYHGDGREFEPEGTMTLLDAFSLLGPKLQVEADTGDLSYSVGFHRCKHPARPVRDSWPFPSNQIESLLADLAAFDLVEPSQRKHSVNDKKAYWSLTAYGQQVLGEYHRRMIRHNIERKRLDKEVVAAASEE